LGDLLTREPQRLIDVWSSTAELRAYEEAERTILRAASHVISTSRCRRIGWRRILTPRIAAMPPQPFG
jgi:hypothetical protein